MQMFLREAETAKSLEHPSIVDLIDCGLLFFEDLRDRSQIHSRVLDLALGEKPEIYFKSADDFKWELLNVV